MTMVHRRSQSHVTFARFCWPLVFFSLLAQSNQQSLGSRTTEVRSTNTAAHGTVKSNPQDRLKYVWIRPGKFVMGCSPWPQTACEDDEKPAHEVTITRGFWLGQTEVTQAAYERVIGKNPSVFKGANLPVTSVTWYEAQTYCTKTDGRLPTEAEMEYAARAGTAGTPGDFKRIVKQITSGEFRSHDVATRKANPWGLYDMLENVSEWVADWYDPRYYEHSPATDPAGPSEPSRVRALATSICLTKRQSWIASLPDLPGPPRLCRSALPPTSSVGSTGFRCVVNSASLKLKD
jgi:formylglycine-generating enzyme required for sulfatase activity